MLILFSITSFLKDFLMWTMLKHLFNLLLYCFYFIFWFFSHKAGGILSPQPGTRAALPAMEGEVLTPGPPGKSHHLFLQMKCSILMAKKKNLLNCTTTVCTFWHLAVNSVSKLHLEKKQSFLIFE